MSFYILGGIEVELKEGVFYATPDGQLFNKEIIIEFGKNIGKVVMKAANIAARVFKHIATIFNDLWKRARNYIVEMADEIDESRQQVERQRILRQSWKSPKSIVRKSQVMNRKPTFHHARSQL